jgi:hypothetical protein
VTRRSAILSAFRIASRIWLATIQTPVRAQAAAFHAFEAERDAEKAGREFSRGRRSIGVGAVTFEDVGERRALLNGQHACQRHLAGPRLSGAQVGDGRERRHRKLDRRERGTTHRRLSSSVTADGSPAFASRTTTSMIPFTSATLPAISRSTSPAPASPIAEPGEFGDLGDHGLCQLGVDSLERRGR